MIFGREVYTTWDMQELARVRDRLADAGIRCWVRGESVLNAGRYHGVPMIRTEAAYPCRIYVRRKDAEKARHLLLG